MKDLIVEAEAVGGENDEMINDILEPTSPCHQHDGQQFLLQKVVGVLEALLPEDKFYVKDGRIEVEIPLLNVSGESATVKEDGDEEEEEDKYRVAVFQGKVKAA